MKATSTTKIALGPTQVSNILRKHFQQPMPEISVPFVCEPVVKMVNDPDDWRGECPMSPEFVGYAISYTTEKEVEV